MTEPIVSSEARFALEHERKRLAVALARDDNHAALAVLIDRKPTIAAVLLR